MTEHLQLHRFPIGREEQANPVEEAKTTEKDGFTMWRGCRVRKSQAGSAIDNGIQPMGTEVSGSNAAGGSDDRQEGPAQRELRDEMANEMFSLTEEQGVQCPPSTQKPNADASADVEQPDPAQIASARSSDESTKLERDDEPHDDPLPAEAATQRNSLPDQATGRARDLSADVPLPEEEKSNERRRSRMSIANVLNDDAGSTGQGEGML